MFAQHGLALPREVRDQYRRRQRVDGDEVQAGDLVFFETVEPRRVTCRASRSAASSSSTRPARAGVVRVERYTAAYWASLGRRASVERGRRLPIATQTRESASGGDRPGPCESSWPRVVRGRNAARHHEVVLRESRPSRGRTFSGSTRHVDVGRRLGLRVEHLGVALRVRRKRRNVVPTTPPKRAVSSSKL